MSKKQKNKKKREEEKAGSVKVNKNLRIQLEVFLVFKKLAFAMIADYLF